MTREFLLRLFRQEAGLRFASADENTPLTIAKADGIRLAIQHADTKSRDHDNVNPEFIEKE